MGLTCGVEVATMALYLLVGIVSSAVIALLGALCVVGLALGVFWRD